MPEPRVAGQTLRQVGWLRRINGDPEYYGHVHSQRDHDRDDCGVGDYCEPVYVDTTRCRCSATERGFDTNDCEVHN